MNSQRLGAIIFLTIGLGSATGAALVYRSSAALQKRAIPMKGVVQSVETRVDKDNQYYYEASVEWTAPDGKKGRYGSESQSADRIKVGQAIDLLYDPLDPAHPAPGSFTGRYVLGGAFVFVSVVFSGIAIRVLLKNPERAA